MVPRFLCFFLTFAVVFADWELLSFTHCEGSWKCEPTHGGGKWISFTCNHKSPPFKVVLEDLINQFKRTDQLVNTLEFTDCKNMMLDVHLARKSPIKKLIVQNGDLLMLEHEIRTSVYHPQDVILQNIKLVKSLPYGSFTSPDAEDITFDNIHFGQILKGAIWSTKMSGLILEGVNVSLIEEGAIDVTMGSESVVRFEECIFLNLPTRAIQVHGSGATLSVVHSYVDKVADSAIEASVDAFTFSVNTVSGAFGRLNLTSNSITISENKFLGKFSTLFDWAQLFHRHNDETHISLVMENNNYGDVPSPAEESRVLGNCKLQEVIIRTDMKCSITITSSSGLEESDEECHTQGSLASFDCNGKCRKALCGREDEGKNLGTRTQLYTWSVLVIMLAHSYCYF